MEATDTTPQKRIVEQLDFGAKTAKRVGWERFEFALAGPHQVRVTNASYGVEKDDHSYVVGIEKRGGDPVPAECECPADLHREPDCKHKLALATIGGLTVLNAAVTISSSPPPFQESDDGGVTTGADKLQADGGMATVDTVSEECPNGHARCDGPDGDDLPCFDCFEGDR
jgi:hypothetical protein